MTIRKATENDAAALARVSVETWRSAYTGKLPQEFLDSLTLEQRTESWRERLSNPDASRFTLVAETETGQIVGYAGGLPDRDGNPFYTGEVGDIYILPEYQRCGYGRRLMAAVVLRLKEQGHEAILVWSFTANPYRAFYETIGGKAIGEKITEMAGVKLPETCYGWRDLSVFEEIMMG